MGLATVYRHLHMLAERGEVDTTRTATGESLYRLRVSSAACHLICRACGRIVAVGGSEIPDWANRPPPEPGWPSRAHG
jgi:Fur family transcriptional regulator, ferric uptake regulator